MQHKPKLPKNALMNVPLGLIQWGDIGGWTTYRAKNGLLVWFPKTYPDKPPSQAQLAERQKLSTAARNWLNLTQAQRDLYKQAAQRLSLCITPFALYFTLSLPQNANLKQTIEKQSGLELP